MSIKELIIEYLKDGEWHYGGRVEDYIRSLVGAKASNASRRCRELVNENKLYCRRVQIDGKGPHVVQYKVIGVMLTNEPRVNIEQPAMFGVNI